MVRAILFDLDETLISERPLVLFILPQVYEILAKRLNVSKSEAREIFLGEIERMRGRYEWHDWNYFFRRFSLPFKFEELILSYPEKITVLPGVRDTLEILREKYRLAIVTSGPRYQILKLKVSGLLDYFDAVITRDDVKAIKPNPKIVIAALERLKVEPNKAVMVGDSLEQDVLGAKALGIKTVWINQKGDNGYNLPDFEISSISELLEVLEDEGDI